MGARWFYGSLIGLLLVIVLQVVQGLVGLGGLIPPAIAVPIGVLLFEGLVRRCYLYEYVYWMDPLTKRRRRRRVLVSYLQADGTLINVLRPLGDRRVGQVYLKEGNGWVRLYRPSEVGETQPVDVGYVTPEGFVYRPDGSPVAHVSPHGRARWFELWVHRHADVPEGVSEPLGHCIEAGAWVRRVNPASATLLARGSAALLLYREWAYRPTEAPRLAPYMKWDVIFPATLLFALLHLIPGFVESLYRHPFLLPALGPRMSFIVSAMAIYMGLWALLYGLKIYWHSFSDQPLLWLEMMNRQTGIQRWNSWGLVASALGALWAWTTNFLWFPLLFTLTVTFLVSRVLAPGEPWPVERRGPPRPSVRPAPEEAEVEGEEERTYEWELDSPLRRIRWTTSLRFRDDDVRQSRQDNPFYQDWQRARQVYRRVARELVLRGEQSPYVRRLASFILGQSERERLTQFEEIQAVLDFVQEPNIRYALDEDCPEIHQAPEYFRSAVETLYDQRGDCDCKSILAASLLRAMGYPVLLCFSFQAGHAAIAVGGAPDLGEDLFFIPWKGQRFYFCEVTGDGWTVG